MKQKVMAILLTVSMVLACVGCGADKTKDEQDTKTSDVDTTQNAGAEADGEETEKHATIRDMKDVEDVDAYAEAVNYSDIYDLLGAIPAIEGKIKVGFTIKALENEYWSVLKAGVEDGVKELQEAGIDIELDVRAAEGESDEQGQAAVMSDMINRDYDIILASPISDGNLVQATEKAHEKGIPVVCAVGGFVQAMDVFAGPQNMQGGALAAEWVANKLGEEGGEVAVITGLTQEAGARNRTQGFSDYMGKNAPQCKVVDTQNGEWNREKARSVMQTLLKKYPDLKAVYCNNDTMALGAVEAVKAAGADVLVVGNDAVNEALDSIRNGDLDATVNVFPDYGGRMALDIALRMYAGQELPKVIYTSQCVIDKDNLDTPNDEILGWKPLEFTSE